ncbi:hypothetical protein KKG51_00750, partial [Patescibacteria group bacterium]|nr:hypothetical protein [Patescibacteria group bacterium]
MTKYAEIGFQRKVGLRDSLTYKIPAGAKTGSLVELPLRNQKTHGLVIRTSSKKPEFSVREITGVASENLLQKWQIDLL